MNIAASFIIGFFATRSQDLPLVIEIVDSEEAINKFVDAIEGMMGSALVTTIWP